MCSKIFAIFIFLSLIPHTALTMLYADYEINYRDDEEDTGLAIEHAPLPPSDKIDEDVEFFSLKFSLGNSLGEDEGGGVGPEDLISNVLPPFGDNEEAARLLIAPHLYNTSETLVEGQEIKFSRTETTILGDQESKKMVIAKKLCNHVPKIRSFVTRNVLSSTIDGLVSLVLANAFCSHNHAENTPYLNSSLDSEIAHLLEKYFDLVALRQNINLQGLEYGTVMALREKLPEFGRTKVEKEYLANNKDLIINLLLDEGGSKPSTSELPEEQDKPVQSTLEPITSGSTPPVGGNEDSAAAPSQKKGKTKGEKIAKFLQNRAVISYVQIAAQVGIGAARMAPFLLAAV
jgi:hypothetical protein